MRISTLCVFLWATALFGASTVFASAWVQTEDRVLSKLILETAMDGFLEQSLDGKDIKVKSTVKGLKDLKVSFPKDSVIIKVKNLFRHRKTAPKEYQAEFFVQGTNVKFSGKYRIHETKEIEVFGVKKKITLIDHTFDLNSKMTFQVSGTLGFGTTKIEGGAEFFKAPLFEIKSEGKSKFMRSAQSLGSGVNVTDIHVVSLESTELVEKIQQFTGTDLRSVLNKQFNHEGNKKRINSEVNKEIDKQYQNKKTRVYGKIAKLALEL